MNRSIMFLEYLVLFASLAFVACSEESSSTSAALESPFNPNIEYGELADSRDGQTYKTVKIGEQVWMAQNLNYEIADSYCCDDDANKCSKFGRYYTWAAAVGKTEDECGYSKNCDLGLNRVQGICPDGWHVPDTTEWKTLIVTVDGSITEYNSTNVAGLKLKAQSGWRGYQITESGLPEFVGNVSNEDAYGFSALPAGYRIYGMFANVGFSAYFWSASQDRYADAYFMGLNGFDGAYLSHDPKDRVFSVRCLKD